MPPEQVKFGVQQSARRRLHAPGHGTEEVTSMQGNPTGPRPTVFLGDRFGRLVVIAEADRDPFNRRTYLCRCDCGEERIVRSGNLRNGHTQSCGCRTREFPPPLQTTHGHARDGERSPTYISWRSMLDRCQHPANHNWQYYGGRGIQVCERWRHFENFLADLGERPDGYTLDRIDSDGNYEPGNCRWATLIEQRHNRRDSRRAA